MANLYVVPEGDVDIEDLEMAQNVMDSVTGLLQAADLLQPVSVNDEKIQDAIDEINRLIGARIRLAVHLTSYQDDEDETGQIATFQSKLEQLLRHEFDGQDLDDDEYPDDIDSGYCDCDVCAEYYLEDFEE